MKAFSECYTIGEIGEIITRYTGRSSKLVTNLSEIAKAYQTKEMYHTKNQIDWINLDEDKAILTEAYLLDWRTDQRTCCMD